jgi:hypothetical protein
MKEVIDYGSYKYEKRHEEFQLGKNPMQMSAYEQSMVKQEEEERKMACHNYIKGIQGRDGGPMPSDPEWGEKGAL